MGLIDNRDAQFMLLAGFIIALGIVITTVLLNNIIFQANMAGEAGSDPSKYEIVNLMAITSDDTKSAYRSAITQAGGNNAQIAYFNNQTLDFSANLTKIYALHGEAVNMTWDVSNWNNNIYPNFTKNGMAGGIANWTIIQNVNSSNITVNVTGGSFNINITNGTTSYTYNLVCSNCVYNINGTNISSHIKNNYSIIFINGANAYGNYSINGTASGRNFLFDRDYILNVTIKFSTSRVRAIITIPVSVPW